MPDVTLDMGTTPTKLTNARDRARRRLVEAYVDLEELRALESSRELALVNTKLEEASMWFYKHLRNVGEV